MSALADRYEKRFWDKVTKTAGCWLWKSYTDGKGYGQLSVGGRANRKNLLAHRVAWELTRGTIPSGICVLHRCDTPLCVNPDHLFLGTKADNSADMVAKGRMGQQRDPSRQARGARVGIAKLTDDVVRTLRREYENGARQVDLAQRYGITQTNVSMITRRRTWAHV